MAKELDECKANVREREDELDRLLATFGADRFERANLNDKQASQYVSTVPEDWRPPQDGSKHSYRPSPGIYNRGGIGDNKIVQD